MILIDNGGNFFLSGAPDERWDNSHLAYLGQAVHGSDFQVVDTSTLHVPKPVTVGSGPDSLVLKIHEDAYMGNASFNVTVDGNPVGGTLTTTAVSAANDQVFTLQGDFGPGQHNVSVSFANPLADAGGARHLYVDSVTFDGYAPLSQSSSPVLVGAAGAAFSVGRYTEIGSGADTLVLGVCDDALQGHAQFTVSVDGTQVGGVQTVATSRSTGRVENFVLHGDWGTQQHVVRVDFTNGMSDATTGLSRDLFLWNASYDGTTIQTAVSNLYGGGSATFQVGNPLLVGSGPDSLVLHLCEDAYQGVDVQYRVMVDGTQVGGVQTATQYRSTGHTQDVTFRGNWGDGQHQVVVDVLNGNNVRSLFVWGMNLDGTDYWNNMANLYGGGSASFLVGQPKPVGTGHDALVLHLSEDAFQGVNVQYTVSVDGVQVGGVQNALTYRSTGRMQDVTFLGDWGSGNHTVSVNVLNGNNVRSLFIWGMSYGGTEHWSNLAFLYGGGSATFSV
jgi:hypothetical protein